METLVVIGMGCIFLIILVYLIRIARCSDAKRSVQETAARVLLPPEKMDVWQGKKDRMEKLIDRYPWRAQRLANLIAGCADHLQANLYHQEPLGNPWADLRREFGEAAVEEVKKIFQI